MTTNNKISKCEHGTFTNLNCYHGCNKPSEIDEEKDIQRVIRNIVKEHKKTGTMVFRGPEFELAKPSEPVSEMIQYWIYPRDRKMGDPDWEPAFQYPDALSDMKYPAVHAIEYRAFEQERAKVKEIQAKYDELLSYLPKVPMMPHDKEMAKRIVELEKELNTLKNIHIQGEFK